MLARLSDIAWIGVVVTYTATALAIMLALTKQPATQQITKSTLFLYNVMTGH